MRERTSAAGIVLSLLVCLAASAPALPWSGLAAATLPDLEVTDLWDYPENLSAGTTHHRFAITTTSADAHSAAWRHFSRPRNARA